MSLPLAVSTIVVELLEALLKLEVLVVVGKKGEVEVEVVEVVLVELELEIDEWSVCARNDVAPKEAEA
jgi:hypothetical protein